MDMETVVGGLRMKDRNLTGNPTTLDEMDEVMSYIYWDLQESNTELKSAKRSTGKLSQQAMAGTTNDRPMDD